MKSYKISYIFLLPHADRTWHKVSLMWRAQVHVLKPSTKIAQPTPLICTDISITTNERGTSAGNCFPRLGTSIIFSVRLCLQTPLRWNLVYLPESRYYTLIPAKRPELARFQMCSLFWHYMCIHCIVIYVDGCVCVCNRMGKYR